MNDEAKPNARARKLQAVDLAFQFLNEAEQSTIRAGFTGNRPKVDLEVQMPPWKVSTATQFADAGISAAWIQIIEEVPHTGIGLSLAREYLGILRMRLKDRRDDGLDEPDASRTSIMGWFDTIGSGLISQASDRRTLPTSHKEDQEFPELLRGRLQDVREWSVKQQSLVSTIVSGEIGLIENRYEGEAPYEMSEANAWHIGWSMVAMASIMADVVRDSLPGYSSRLCRFDEAQRVRRNFRNSGLIHCPRCGTDIETDFESTTLGTSSLRVIAVRCESCELQIQFPDQADPKSIWSGPPISVKESAEAANPERERNKESDNEDQHCINGTNADPKKVFIIYGRNAKAAREMENFVRAAGLDPVSFDDVSGRLGGAVSIADVVTQGMNEAQGVIALFTGDEWAELRPDLRGNRDKPHDVARWQARPNVIFEAGMAFGRDRKRVVFVVIGDAELFSDVGGIIYMQPTNASAASRRALHLKLKGMGCDVSDSLDWMTAGDFDGAIRPELETRSPFGNDTPATNTPVLTLGAENTSTPLTDAKIEADRHTIKSLAGVMNSSWMRTFWDGQVNAPQFISQGQLDVLRKYLTVADEPENKFYCVELSASHETLLEDIDSYLMVSGRERVPLDGKLHAYVITTKATPVVLSKEEYDTRHHKQVTVIESAVRKLWASWSEYARAAKLFEVSNNATTAP